ncbi:MAG TPA: NAD(P)/FAD-dependent oxidoreductase [Pseudonocardiaceae bacterium]
MTSHSYDVVIIGGGPAGLGAGLTLSRARRRVLVVDAGRPRNRSAAHAHNYLGREGVPPLELLAIGRDEVAGYGGEVRAGTVTSVTRLDSGGFRVHIAGQSTVDARRVLLATGLVDDLPPIPGIADRWGRDVLHCPYCHGWETRDRPVGIIGVGPGSIHQALLWRQWTDEVTLLTNDVVEPTDEDRVKLAARGITVVAGKVERLVVEDDALTGIELGDGVVVAMDFAVVLPVAHAEDGPLAELGLRAVEQQMAGAPVGTVLPKASPSGATEVPGVWVAGNVGDHRAQVIVSAADGVMVGAQINFDLVDEDTARAVAAYPFTPEMEREVCDRVLADRRHGLTPSG